MLVRYRCLIVLGRHHILDVPKDAPKTFTVTCFSLTVLQPCLRGDAQTWGRTDAVSECRSYLGVNAKMTMSS
jgi:hypothetical protein